MNRQTEDLAKRLVNEGLRPLVGISDSYEDRVLRIESDGCITTSELVSIRWGGQDDHEHYSQTFDRFCDWYPDLDDAGTLGVIRADVAKRFEAFDIVVTPDREGDVVRWAAITLDGAEAATGTIDWSDDEDDTERISPLALAVADAWVQAPKAPDEVYKQIFQFYP